MRHGAWPWIIGLSLSTAPLQLGCSEGTYDIQAKRSCTNKELDTGETDVDCGGGGCDRCAALKLCAADKNCDTGLLCITDPTSAAAEKRCQLTHCTDSKRNEAETDVDCGGKCWPCTASQKCKSDNDCQSHVCTEGVCIQATCADGRLNQDETDVDCGSILTRCDGCGAGKSCFRDENCETRLCAEGKCKEASCGDSRQNGDEGGVDCGGSCPNRCGQGLTCGKDADCDSSVCRGGACLPAQCGDGARNGIETDVDCGGSCAKCQQNAGCNEDTDCTTEFCSAHICQVATCTDGIKNQGEADTDCGDARQYCGRCVANQICVESTQCASGNCVAGRCVERSCADSIKNGSEGDVDCGADCPNRCADGATCKQMSDCASQVCGVDSRCAAPTCGDGVENGLEPDKDCGGNCPAKCEIGQGCNLHSDCRINSCAVGACVDPLCTNSTKDGSETDIDCGGARCGSCLDGKVCGLSSDCASANCVGHQCASASCSDTIKNGLETDIDCGGNCEKRCPDGGVCSRDLDCTSGKCAAGKCQQHTCTDGVRNGKETDADCGGASCIQLGAVCELKANCLVDADCRSAVCDATKGICEPQSCSDSRLNQDETDFDCGGKVCGGNCRTGKRCLANTDCADRVCTNNRCAEPTCTDGMNNGLEGGTDCGTACSPKLCAVNSLCKNDADCAEKVCGTSSGPTLRCLAPTCTDGKPNGSELDVDCGLAACGTAKCQPGQRCASEKDCDTAKFADMKCAGTPSACVPAGCSDLTANASESDVDCGGSCKPCAVGRKCKTNSDCDPIASGLCSSVLTCAAATCDDGIKNGAETGVDCGGDVSTSFPVPCTRCPPLQPCKKDSDCDNVRCTGGICQNPSCTDGLTNSAESDVDCGASCSAIGGTRCENTKACGTDADCASGWCQPTTHECATRTCTDGLKNGAEGDVDCGSICQVSTKLCAIGKGCNTDSDCSSGYCSECNKICMSTPANCLNPLKTGATCPTCDIGQACSVDTDCLSLNCSSGSCAAPDSCSGAALVQAKTDVNICNQTSLSAANQAICFAYMRCLFLYQNCTTNAKACCTPSDYCYTNGDGVCNQNRSWAGNGDVPQKPFVKSWAAVCPSGRWQ